MNYTNADFVFRCAIYDRNQLGEKELQFNETEAKVRVTVLQDYIRSLDETLMNWKRSVDTAREKYYELNYFTTLQLLQLRKELGMLTEQHTLKPQTLMLLKSVSPDVTDLVVTDSLQAAEHPELLECGEEAEAILGATSLATVTSLDATVEDEKVSIPVNEEQSFQHVAALPSSRFLLPVLTYEDLPEFQQVIHTNCVELYGLSDGHILKAFEECGENATLYDIERWCEDNEDCSPQEEECSVGMADREEEMPSVYNPQEYSDSDEDIKENRAVALPLMEDCESE